MVFHFYFHYLHVYGRIAIMYTFLRYMIVYLKWTVDLFIAL